MRHISHAYLPELRLGVDHVKSEVRARPASGHLPPHLPPISRQSRGLPPTCHPQGFSIEDAISRLKRVVAIVDKTVVAPLITPAVAADETTTEADERPLPVTGVAESTDEETDVMHDAVEGDAAEGEEEEDE